MTSFDSGSGPETYIAGDIGSVAGTPAVGIARLTNSGAQPLAAGLLGRVNALAVFNDGTGAKLYAGGSFVQSGSTLLLHLAAWNGSVWSAVGGGTNGEVRALTAHNDGSGNALFVGGAFSNAGGVSVSNIARWNGSTWTSLAGGVTGAVDYNVVNTLFSRTDLSTPVLYAAGRIVTAGGLPATPVVQWNGTAWVNVGTEATGNTSLAVNALATYDNSTGLALYRASSTGLNRLNGNVWGGSSGGATYGTSLQVFHDSTPRGTLYMGSTAGVYKHTGQTNVIASDGAVYSLCEIPSPQGPKLMAGGSFGSVAGVPATNLAAYSETALWQSAAPVMHGGTVTGFVQSQDHASTYIAFDGGIGVGKLNSGTVSRLSGTRGETFALDLESIDINGVPTLVACGGLTSSTGSFRDVLAWQNDVPAAIPSPFSTFTGFSANDLCISHAGGTTSLLLGGRFLLAGGGSQHHGILRYSSPGISVVASDPHPDLWVDRMVTRMTPEGEYIYVAGVYFPGSPVGPPIFMLSPDGTWTTVTGTLTYQGTDSNLYEYCLAWFDDDDGGHLYVGGQFDTVNGQPAHGIARVVGTTLEPLAQGIDGAQPLIRDLMVFDDGSGPALYAAGRFDSAGGVPANNIARLKNGHWSAVAGGVTMPTSVVYYDPPIVHLKTVSDSSGDWLYSMGNFMIANGQLSPKVARYGRCRCLADFNGDNAIDFFDYLDFVSAFADGLPSADFNHDSVIDFFDYLDFVAAFSQGC